MDAKRGRLSRSGFSVLGTAVIMLATSLILLSDHQLAPVAGAAANRSNAPLAPEQGVLFGAHVQATSGANPFVVVEQLEGKLGRTLAIDHYYKTWDAPFPDGREDWDLAAGRIPMVSWGKTGTGEVNNGSHDALIRQRAQGVKKFGQLMFIRWFWEMGGNRNAATAVSPADFIAAWKHIRAVFAEEGASNAVWVWCPDASDFVDGRAQSFYPGDDAVDWTCADGYNYRHPARRNSQPRSFADTFSAFYAWAAERPKPIMIGEYGTVEDGPGDKARWVDASVEALKTRFPGLAAVVYYHSLRERDGFTYDWRMDTSPESMASFSAMGADPYLNPPVARTLPDTAIDSGPEGVVAGKGATFTFSERRGEGSQPAEGFECRVDAPSSSHAGFAPCTSPAAAEGLADGAHAFEVRARGPFGRVDTTPARREWTVDASPPKIDKITPEDGATGVAADAVISATFSEEIDPRAVKADAFTLTAEGPGAAAIPVAVSYDPKTKTVTLKPQQELTPLVTYKATVAPGAVADKAGNKLAAEKSWRFTVGLAAGGLPGLGQ